jgi:heterodisulfide reductase subunit C
MIAIFAMVNLRSGPPLRTQGGKPAPDAGSVASQVIEAIEEEQRAPKRIYSACGPKKSPQISGGTLPGERFVNLLGCPFRGGICSGSCPMGKAMDFPPRKAVKMLLEGRFDEVVGSDTL